MGRGNLTRCDVDFLLLLFFSRTRGRYDVDFFFFSFAGGLGAHIKKFFFFHFPFFAIGRYDVGFIFPILLFCKEQI